MVNLKEYLVVVNNRLIPLTGAIAEDQLGSWSSAFFLSDRLIKFRKRSIQ
ncbi:hypothetical protein RSX31_09220 [Rossellomorea sp. YC4-1]|nr:hypothetical protein [Rossellomorea sp. YC4-1]